MEGVYKYVTQLANAQRRLIDRLARDRAYSGAQGKVIHYLFENKDRIVYQKDIERDFGVRPATATELIKTLEKMEMIRRIPSSKDGRYKEIVLTENADVLKQTVSGDMHELESCMTKGIEEDQLRLWAEITGKMLENLGEELK